MGAGGTSGTLGADTGTIVNNGTLSVKRSDAFTLANTVAGTGGVSQDGTGTTTLSSANTYSGSTNVNAGTLRVQGGNAIANAGVVNVAPAGTLDVATNETIGTLTSSGNITSTGNTLTASSYTLNAGTVDANLGAGTLTKATTGSATLNGTAGATTVNVNAGTLNIGASDRLNDNAYVTIASGATIAMGPR